MKQLENENDTNIENIFDKKVILYNDRINTFDHVVETLSEVCRHSIDECIRIAIEAHEYGKSICYTGSEEVCDTVLDILAENDLTVGME